MPLESTETRWIYDGDGVTTVFQYGNMIFATTDLKVYVGGVLATLTTDYSVTNVGVADGGNVVFAEAPAEGTNNVLILRDVPATQKIKFPETNPIPSGSLTKGLDKLTVLVQQLAARLVGAVRRADTSTSTADLTLPEPSAGKAIGWNADGDGLTNDPADFASTVTAVAASAATATSAASAASDAADDAETAQAAAAVSAAAAAASAASVDLPEAPAENTMLVRGPASWLAKTFVEVKTLLGLGTAALEDVAVGGTGGLLRADGDGSGLAGLSAADQIARDMAVVALVEANAAGVAGTKGRLVLTNPFTSDTLTTKTNGTYDAANDCYDNRGALSSDLIPTMTSNTTPSGVASESSAQGGAAWNAFDDNFTSAVTGMYTNSFPAWLQYQFSTAQVVNAYTITPEGSYRWPVTWEFQGSNDGSSWTTLHSVTGESTSGWTEKRTYEFSNSTAYTHYRLYVTAGTDGTYLMINEVEMLSRTSPQNATFAVAGGSGGLDIADPSDLSAYFLFEFPDADVTVGTDVTGELSIDGGTTQATGAWTKIGDYGAGELWRLDADVSAQTGDNPHWEINTLNNKAVELHACGGVLPIY